MHNVSSRSLQGLVTELDVSGWGPNSSQLEFAIKPIVGPTETLVMQFDAVPQMFAVATTILVAAYFAKTLVEVTIPRNQPPLDTPRISGVKVPV